MMKLNVWIGILILSLLAGCADNNSVNKKLLKINQNVLRYVTDAPNQTLWDDRTAELAKQNFLQYYFSPWRDSGTLFSTEEVKQLLQQELDQYSRTQGWGENYLKYGPEFIKNLIVESNLATYPNFIHPAITIHASNIRVLPTQLPFFDDPKKAGEGYPFDLFQASYIASNVPLRVLHASLDRQWYLVNCSGYFGWIPVDDVAFVTPDFIKQWEQGPFVIVTRDNVPVIHHAVMEVSTRMGVLYPFIKFSVDQIEIAVAQREVNNDYATLVTGTSQKKYFEMFPLKLTQFNVANLAVSMLNTAYGWGSMYGLRDCSETTQSLLAPFGIWLPRNSAKQAQRGQIYSLKGLSSDEKIAMIKQYGVPFVTLLNLPGHVALYIGVKDGVPYVIQDVWALKTVNLFGKEGRAVIGRTVITPINFGKDFLNVKQTILDRIETMSVLTRNFN